MLHRFNVARAGRQSNITFESFITLLSHEVGQLSLMYVGKADMQHLREEFINVVEVHEVLGVALRNLLDYVNAQSRGFKRKFLQGVPEAVAGLNAVKVNSGLPLVVADYLDEDGPYDLEMVRDNFCNYLMAKFNILLSKCDANNVTQKIGQFDQTMHNSSEEARTKVRFSARIKVQILE